MVALAGVLSWYAIAHQKNVPLQTAQQSVALDIKNATYRIDEESVTLSGGAAHTPIAPGSASVATTQYFGNEAHGDIDGDGVSDTAFLLTRDGGGSGTFFYLAALLSSAPHGVGTNAIFLGDRIAPQTTNIKDGVITVNYADRKPTDSMATPPSVGMSKRIMSIGGSLVSMDEVRTTNATLFAPTAWGTAYVHPFAWPPEVTFLKKAYACTAGGKQTAQGGKTDEQVFFGHTYCVTTESEGAAGSTYTNYVYTFAHGAGSAELRFTVRIPQCANYDEPKQSACKQEIADTNISLITAVVAQTLE
jgi:hypothetical protein